MAHPLIEEFSRIPGVNNCRPEVFNRVQRELQSTIQPLLDERDALEQTVRRLERDKFYLLQDVENLKHGKNKAVTSRPPGPPSHEPPV